MIEVVNLYSRGFEAQAGDVYIGRAGRGESGEFGNPFSIGRDGNREEVISKYEQWLIGHPQLVLRLADLKPKRLVCFCKPLACHGDVLAAALEELK